MKDFMIIILLAFFATNSFAENLSMTGITKDGSNCIFEIEFSSAKILEAEETGKNFGIRKLQNQVIALKII